MQITDNFTLAELTVTKTGLPNNPPGAEFLNLRKAAAMMEEVRALLGHPIKVNSGYRSPAVNAAVGGSPTSDHVKGYAVDFVCPSFGDPRAIALAIRASKIKFDQLIFENAGAPVGQQWVHLSAAPRGRRQVLTMRGGKYLPGIV